MRPSVGQSTRLRFCWVWCSRRSDGFDMEFKYAQAHIYSSYAPPFAKAQRHVAKSFSRCPASQHQHLIPESNSVGVPSETGASVSSSGQQSTGQWRMDNAPPSDSSSRRVVTVQSNPVRQCGSILPARCLASAIDTTDICERTKVTEKSESWATRQIRSHR